MNQIYQHYVYTTEGRIRGIVCNANLETMENCVDPYISIAADSTNPIYTTHSHYILNSQPTERPASPVTIDGRRLYDVPAGSTLWIDGESYEAEGYVELDFIMPGTYKLRVICFPYLDWEYELVML